MWRGVGPEALCRLPFRGSRPNQARAGCGFASPPIVASAVTRVRAVPEKADHAGHLRVYDAQSLHQQFGVTIRRARRKAGGVTIANNNGLRVLRLGAILKA